MQTGKFLGIGAALSAGLLAAHVASASTLTLEEFVAGGTGSASYGTTKLTSAGSGAYAAVSGSYDNGQVAWSGVTVTVGQTSNGASLQLAITGLQDTVGDWGFIVSDTAFLSVSGASLTETGSYSVSLGGSSSTGDSFSAVGYADPGNYLLGVPSGAGLPSNVHVSPTAYSAAPASFGPADSSTATTGTVSPVSLPGAYSLTTEGTINSAAYPGGTYNVDFTTAVAGTAPSAVTLPGSGPLTIVGGLVVVGGLAVRRRFKV